MPHLELFPDADFGGNPHVIDDVKAVPKNTLQSLAGKPIQDNTSSVRVNLPEHVIVVLHENGDGTGKQLVVHGTNSILKVSKHAFNDCASSWEWREV